MGSSDYPSSRWNRSRCLNLVRKYNLPKSLKTPGSSKELRDGHQGLLRFVPILCIAVLLLNTFRLYKDAYFWLDDFNNLDLVQQESFAHMIGYIVNPLGVFPRPTG